MKLNENQQVMYDDLKANFSRDNNISNVLYNVLLDDEEDLLTNAEFCQVLRNFIDWIEKD